MRRQLLIIAACIGVTIARVLGVQDALPQRMATHFGPSGEPNGFSEPHAFFVLYGLISVMVLGGLLLTPLLTRALPVNLINLPNRDYWLVPARKDEALAKLASWSAWFAAWLALFLAGTLELVLRTNLARGPLDNTWFVALLATFVLGAAFGLMRLGRAFRVP